MNRLVGWLRYILGILLLASTVAHADVVLTGSMNIGDDSVAALSPLVMVSKTSSTYQPVNPIYFTLTESGTLSQVTLNNLTGADYGVNLVIWDSSGNVLVSTTSSNQSPSVFTVSKTLSAGTYRMAVWGQCVGPQIFSWLGNGCASNSILHPLYQWDDIQFSGITLVGLNSTVQHFIERKHIGDSSDTDTDTDRWYPDTPSGVQTTYSLSYSTATQITQLTLYHLRDWQVDNNSNISIWSNSTNTMLWQHIFTAADNATTVLLTPGLTVDAGSYTIIVTTNPPGWSDADDISWDELTVNSSTSQSYDCGSVFPYPVQGRSSTDTLALGGGYNTSAAGKIYGTTNGQIGIPNISGYNTTGNYTGNCDGVTCTFAALGGSMTLAASKFPTTGTKNMSEAFWSTSYQSSLTSADGTAFGTIEISNNTSFAIHQPGITIQNLILRSGSKTIVTLDAGEYWIDNLTLESGSQLMMNGDVVLHVKNMTVGSTSYVNMSPTTSYSTSTGGDTSQLLIILYGPLKVGNNAGVSAMIYSTDDNTANPDIDLTSSPGFIYGRISAHHIAMSWGSTIFGADSWCTTGNYDINHYEIRYPAEQISCEPAVITINACSNSDTSSCVVNTNVNKTVDMASPTSGWSTTTVTLTNGTGTATLNHYAVGSAKLGLVQTPYTCFSNNVKDDTCTMSFVGSQFSFNIPTFYAGGNSGSVSLKAIQSQSSSSGAVCVALLKGTQNVAFSRTYVTSATGDTNPTINNTTVTSNTTVPLTFDDNGVASIVMGYADAGVLQMSAAASITSQTAGTYSVSGSDNVAVIPHQVRLTAPDAPSCSGTDDASYAACSIFKSTGSEFTLTGRAGYLQGTSFVTTPGYSSDLVQIPLTISHELLAPSSGVLSDYATIPSLSLSSGTGNATVSEADVGVYSYSVNAFVPYPAYQDESPQLTTSVVWSDPVGRIVPVALHTRLADEGTLTTATCVAQNKLSSLGYMGQSLEYANQSAPILQVYAVGADGSTLLNNYQGDFAKITQAFPDGSGSGVFDLTMQSTSDSSLGATATWHAGSWTSPSTGLQQYTFSSSDTFVFGKSASQRYNYFEPGLTLTQLSDSDGIVGVIGTDLQNFKPTTPAIGSFYVYDGRLVGTSANTDENSALALPMMMQYWNGSSYVLNDNDSCTSLSTDDLLMNDQTSWQNIALRSESSGSPATTTAVAAAAFSNGAMDIQFTAPGASGWVDLTAGAQLPDWMKDPTTTSGFIPVRASFGFFRGNDRVIYRREVFGNQ